MCIQLTCSATRSVIKYMEKRIICIPENVLILNGIARIPDEEYGRPVVHWYLNTDLFYCASEGRNVQHNRQKT